MVEAKNKNHEVRQFTLTITPGLEEETLIARSQAKRLLVRFDSFKEVVFDFKDVKSIGPAFADEIFRVFHQQHPQIRLMWLNANAEVEKMIRRALSHGERA
jgi:hypothetical protein